MRLAVKVGLALVLAASLLAVVVVAAGGGVDVFVTLLLLVLLVLRETPAGQAPEAMRARIGVFVFLGALAFAFVIVQRVRRVLNL